MTDPLLYFYSRFGYDPELVLRRAAGVKYVGIMLKNGQVGVCSTLNLMVKEKELLFHDPDLGNKAHRVCYNAYLNALLNYSADIEDNKDIFQHIDFSGRKEITMVGFFRPLVKKFVDAGIGLKVFDLVEEDEILAPLDQMDSILNYTRTLILTSTTVFNGSFLNILQHTPDQCEVFLLGPSSILHEDMKKYRNIRKVYGAIFSPFDDRILDIIADGHGTQTFLKHGKKVNI